MEPPLEVFESAATAEDVIAAFERDGGVIVKDFLPPSVIDTLVDDMTPHIDAVDWLNTGDYDELGAEFFGRKTKRLHGLPGLSRATSDVALHPLFHAISDATQSPHCHDVKISTTELMVLGHGQAAQVLHRDGDSWGHFPAPRPEILVSVNVALTDFTQDNGATVVVPGSHKWEPGREAKANECTKAVMARGSALLYSGNVIHGGGANNTDDIRIGFYCGLLLSWLRPIENQLITTGLAALQALPKRMQELCGYSEAGWDVYP